MVAGQADHGCHAIALVVPGLLLQRRVIVIVECHRVTKAFVAQLHTSATTKRRCHSDRKLMALSTPLSLIPQQRTVCAPDRATNSWAEKPLSAKVCNSSSALAVSCGSRPSGSAAVASRLPTCRAPQNELSPWLGSCFYIHFKLGNTTWSRTLASSSLLQCINEKCHVSPKGTVMFGPPVKATAVAPPSATRSA